MADNPNGKTGSVWRRSSGAVHQPIFRSGQLVLKLETGEVVEVVFHDQQYDDYLLSDGSWLGAEDLEDPLRAGRQRDMLRSARMNRPVRSARSNRQPVEGPSIWPLLLLTGAYLAFLVSWLTSG